jgi:Arc/MetJ-type ribon-helix-helix transcriptional regulator
MPKMQVYLPAELYQRVKARGDAFNVSSVLRKALEESLAELDRREALDAAIRVYESGHGRIGSKEIARQEAADRAAARRPSLRRGRGKKRAA